jgi:hypothetical protein
MGKKMSDSWYKMPKKPAEEPAEEPKEGEGLKLKLTEILENLCSDPVLLDCVKRGETMTGWRDTAEFSYKVTCDESNNSTEDEERREIHVSLEARPKTARMKAKFSALFKAESPVPYEFPPLSKGLTDRIEKLKEEGNL